MRKLVTYLLFIAVAMVIVSIFGVAHHQVTYTVSPEYYTKFKFIQLDLADTLAAQHMTQPRSAVVIAGVKTSWLIGLCIGGILGFVALIVRSADTLFRSAFQALALVLLIATLAGACAWLQDSHGGIDIGKSAYETLPSPLPNSLHNKPAFLKAASIQSGILLGWVVGLLAGMVYLFAKNGRVRRQPRRPFPPEVFDQPR